MSRPIFRGRRTGNGLLVWYHDADFDKWIPLPLRLDLYNHSPTGFECGYGGSGPAQLALAMLAHVLNNDNRALKLHQRFKQRVVARLPHDGDWELNRADLNLVLRELWRELH
jgi:hypothetical protein